MRAGIGYDIHRLVANRKLVLGGVEIPYPKGCAGHSDADVLLHAVCDALLGAANLGDIGIHFPNTDMRYKDISSTRLLEKVHTLLQEKGYCVNNVDVVVIAEKPELKNFIVSIKEKIADILKTSVSTISVKATTNEGCGSIGSGEAIASYAVATVHEKK